MKTLKEFLLTMLGLYSIVGIVIMVSYIVIHAVKLAPNTGFWSVTVVGVLIFIGSRIK